MGKNASVKKLKEKTNGTRAYMDTPRLVNKSNVG
jgi:hypothetical protein